MPCVPVRDDHCVFWRGSDHQSEQVKRLASRGECRRRTHARARSVVLHACMMARWRNVNTTLWHVRTRALKETHSLSRFTCCGLLPATALVACSPRNPLLRPTVDPSSDLQAVAVCAVHAVNLFLVCTWFLQSSYINSNDICRLIKPMTLCLCYSTCFPVYARAVRSQQWTHARAVRDRRSTTQHAYSYVHLSQSFSTARKYGNNIVTKSKLARSSKPQIL